MKRLLILLTTLAALPAFAVNDPRYVSMTGNDASNNCLNSGTPCRTIQTAVTLAQCGDTVIVAAGGPYAGFTVSNKNCTQASQLHIRPSIYPTRSTASTGSQITHASGNAYYNTGSNWVTFEGFYINQNAGASFAMYLLGDRAAGRGQHNTIKNVEVKAQIRPSIQPCSPTCGQLGASTGEAINGPFQDYLIVDGLIAGRDPAGSCNNCDETNCVAMSSQRWTIFQNSTCYGYRSHGNFSNGYDITYQDNHHHDLKNHGVGFLDSQYALLQRNTWDYTNTDLAIEDIIWILCSSHINARNNAVIGNVVRSPVQGFMTHNNCENTAFGNTPVDTWNLNQSISQDIKFTNNIFTGLWGITSTHGLPVAFPETSLITGPLVVDYNLYNNNRHTADLGGALLDLAAWRDAAFLCPGGIDCQDLNSITSAPTFVDPNNATWALRDYRPLNGSSPQVDAGDDTNCAHTILGAHCDIGPYEFSGAAAPDTTAPSPIANVAPANAATGIGLTPTLQASTASDATGPVEYEFQLFTAAVCTGGTSQTRAYATGSTWVPTALSASTQYAWRYRARDSVGTPNVSSYSTCTTFTTMAATTDIGCTNADFETAIAEINAGTRTLITWSDSCANTTIQITADAYPGTTRATARTLASNRPNVVIDGEDKNIRFDMNPPWWDNDTTLCAGGNCDPGNTGTPTLCPTSHDGATDQWFVRLLGTGQKVKNLEYRYFMEGIRMEADDTELDNVVGILPGDEDVSNWGGANAIIRNSTFSAACDKNIQAYGDEALGSADWDMQIYDTVVTNSSSGIRISGTAGRYYVEGSFFTEDAPSSSLFNSQGPYIGDVGGTDAIAFYMKDSIVDLTRRGIRVTGASHFISLGGNTFQNNTRRGLSCEGQARCLVQGDTFTNNGGVGAATADQIPGYGAVAVGGTCLGGTGNCASTPYAANCACTVNADCQSNSCSAPVVDLGGGLQTLDGSLQSSLGGNTFSGNASLTDSTLAIHNLTPTQMKAENNCFGTSIPSVAATYVTGSADIDPLGSCGAPAVYGLRSSGKASFH